MSYYTCGDIWSTQCKYKQKHTHTHTHTSNPTIFSVVATPCASAGYTCFLR